MTEVEHDSSGEILLGQEGAEETAEREHEMDDSDARRNTEDGVMVEREAISDEERSTQTEERAPENDQEEGDP